MPPTDEELIRQIAEQDADAFEILLSRYEEALRRHLKSIVRDAHSADDLLQEAFLRIWTRAGQWQADGPAKAWIFRIATNLALNHLRSVRRRKETPLEPSPDPMDDSDDTYVPGWMIDASSLGTDELVEQEEQTALVRKLVGNLPKEKRDVARLVYIVGMEVRQAAERLGIPTGTVKSRLHYARKQLADEWREIENGRKENDK